MGFSLGATDLTSTHPAVLSTRTSCELTMSPLVRSTAIPVPWSKVYTSPENFSPVEVTPDTSCPMPQSSAPIVRRPGGGATKERGDRSWARQILGESGRDTGFTVCTQLLRLREHLSAPAWQHTERIFSSLFHVLIRKICRNVGLDGLFFFPPHIFFPDCFTVVLIPEHSPPTGNTNKSLKSYPPKAPKDGAANAEARTGGASLPSDRARRSTSGCTTE